MSKKPRNYARLTRARGGVGTYSSLWLAEDHLLQVVSSGFHERYQRFFLRDIKGFLVSPSRMKRNWLIFWGAVFGLFLAILLLAGSDADARFGLSFPTGFAFIFALLVLFFGRNRRVYVVTGVQTTELTSLARRVQVQKVLGRLQPLIETAQADLAAVRPPSAGAAEGVETSSL